jgi:hypothetical protein
MGHYSRGELAGLVLPSKRTGSPLQIVRLDRAAALCLGAQVAGFDELAGFGCTGRGRMDVVFRFFCMVVVAPDRGAENRRDQAFVSLDRREVTKYFLLLKL